ncbi:MAG: tripartite tricarboxylate transporter TctB family protein [Rhodospirillales bacterium]
MRKLAPGQWIEFSFWFVFTGAAFALTFDFDRKVEMYRYGAAGWPRIVIAIIFLAALGQLWQSLFQKEEQESQVGTPAVSEERHDPIGLQMWFIMLTPVIYAFFIEELGYYFLTPFFLFAYLYLTGERRLKWLIIVPLGIFIVLTILFTKFLYVGLPTGNLPGFYDFGSWIVQILQ